MKEYDLIYNPDEDGERYIFSNIDFDKLVPVVNIQREEALHEEEFDFSRKKSEIIEYEKEEYKALKDIEQFPFIVVDGESRTYSGKLNNVFDTGNVYFAFINTGTYLKVIPIKKWYGFVQKNQFLDENVDILDQKLNYIEEIEDSDHASIPDIDYEAEFDDDDENDKVISIVKEKSLNTHGEKLQGLMEDYEEEYKKPTRVANIESAEEEKQEQKNKKFKNTQNKSIKENTQSKLTKEKLKKIIGTNKMPIKDLLMNVKQNYIFGEAEKKTIREFIQEFCVYEINSETNEKAIKLKK